MPRYKCIIEYDGTNFVGWQKQPDLPSVQGSMENALYKFTAQKINIYCSGRTDAGVHALGQVAHFDLQKTMPADKVMGAFNYHLKEHSISVVACSEVTEDFHARFSAKKRSYIYKINNRKAPLTLDAKRMWQVPIKLDEHKMQQAANIMLGEHDFSSFRDSECQANSPVKTIDIITITRTGDIIEIFIQAKSFLHHMVRIITGTLKAAGEGKISPEDITNILQARNRSKAGVTAPPHGLYFLEVCYDTGTLA